MGLWQLLAGARGLLERWLELGKGTLRGTCVCGRASAGPEQGWGLRAVTAVPAAPLCPERVGAAGGVCAITALGRLGHRVPQDRMVHTCVSQQQSVVP